MAHEKFIKVLPQGGSTIENKDQVLKVAGKMILSGNVPIAAEGVILKATGDATKAQIDIREGLEADVKSAVTTEHSKDDLEQIAYKHAIGVIEEELPGDYAAQEALGVVLSKTDEKATICVSPSNCHGSHGDPAHSLDAICNTDPNRKSLRFLVTKGAPDDDTSYIEPDVIKATPKHVLALLPITHRNVPLWGVLVPFNTFGKGNSSTPFKIDPMS